MQQLTDWPGDVESLLTEMKRRAQVSTDSELAEILSTSQSNVSTWRKRGGVPKAALLRFERLNLDNPAAGHRVMAARTIAIRAAEFAHERAGRRGGNSRLVFYSTVAGAWDIIVDAIGSDLKKKERETKKWPMELAALLMEDEHYLGGLADWINGLSASLVLNALRDSMNEADGTS